MGCTFLQLESLKQRLSKAESTCKRLGEQNFQLMAEKEQVSAEAEEARRQLAVLADQVNRLNETRHIRQSLRISLESMDRELCNLGGAHVSGR